MINPSGISVCSACSVRVKTCSPPAQLAVEFEQTLELIALLLEASAWILCRPG